MMKNMLLCSIALLSITSACGGGPTAPTATPAVSTTTAGAPPAPPAPTPPAPAPTPPAPAPDPAPPPVPSPDPGTRYTAHVDTVHWYSEPLFGDTFELERYADRITFAAVTLPILAHDERGFVAKDKEMTFSVVDSTWTFNGLAGTAQGTLSK